VGAQQGGVDDTEHRDVPADGQSHRQNDGRCEQRGLAHHARRVVNIVNEATSTLGRRFAG
jgi:hypothetical protein